MTPNSLFFHYLAGHKNEEDELYQLALRNTENRMRKLHLNINFLKEEKVNINSLRILSYVLGYDPQ